MNTIWRIRGIAVALAALAALACGCSERPPAVQSDPGDSADASHGTLAELRATGSEQIERLEARVTKLESDLAAARNALVLAEEARINEKLEAIDSGLNARHPGTLLSFSRTDLLPDHEREFLDRLSEHGAAGWKSGAVSGLLSKDPTPPAVTVGLTPAKREYRLGEKVEVEVDITNAGAEPVAVFQAYPTSTVVDGSKQMLRPRELTFSADLNGEQVTTIPAPHGTGTRGAARTITIEPAGTHRIRVDLSQWIQFQAPGTYRVTGSHVLSRDASATIDITIVDPEWEIF